MNEQGDTIQLAPNSPSKRGAREFQGIPVSDSETAHLQHLVYKAKFAEQISNDMRVPARIAFDDNPRVNRQHFIRSDSTELMMHSMQVPSRIRLSNDARNLNESDSMLERIDEDVSPVALKTPPRQLRLNDERFSESNDTGLPKSDTISLGTKSPSTENISEKYLKETNPTVNVESTLQKSESMNLDSPEIAALVEILKPEDQNSKVVRQQFFRLFRRISRLEQREKEIQESLDFQRKMTFASITLSVISIGVTMIVSQRKSFY